MPYHNPEVIKRFRSGEEVYRYECNCGKNGKFHKWAKDVQRGLVAHKRAFTPQQRQEAPQPCPTHLHTASYVKPLTSP